ncbi:MAG TPA: hypothetical protein VGF55_01870 [Gemmataceae bacterium]|jgi:hypothetical protein
MGQSVRVGSRAVAVEESWLPTRFVRSHHRFALTWPDDAALEIRYHWGVRLLAWFFCLLGGPVVVLGLLPVVEALARPGAADFGGTACCLLWGVPVTALGVWLFGPRYRFDTSAGLLTIRHCARTRRQPLAPILAVQVIDAGWFGTGPRAGPREATPVRYRSYQLNLVLDDPGEPRLFVAYDCDLTDMARKAAILADFLGVPLLAAPEIHELVRPFRRHDTARPADGRRFRGTDALPAVRDRRLPEPYRSWVDRTRPLPPRVRLLPRSVDVLYDLGTFVIVGGMFIGMDVAIVLTFWERLAAADRALDVVLGAVVVLVGLLPFALLRRLCFTLAAWRDRKRGTLRQGILVGPEGLLVRMEPNRCHPIALDRFVTARIDDRGDSGKTPDYVIDALDGRVAFFFHRSEDHPEVLSRCVAELRSAAASA